MFCKKFRFLSFELSVSTSRLLDAHSKNCVVVIIIIINIIPPSFLLQSKLRILELACPYNRLTDYVQ